MSTHPNEHHLNEFVDGTLAPDEQASVAEHVASCLPCAANVRRITALVERARALPKDVSPPVAAWDEVRAAVHSAHPSSHTRLAHATRGMPRWVLGAAAAAALVVITIGGAMLINREADAPSVEDVARTVAAPPARLAEFAPVEARYVLATSELQETLAERRDALDATTIATIERSLTTIDSAIAEARAALARDPGNMTISHLLASSYEQKVALLRRATELQPRS